VDANERQLGALRQKSITLANQISVLCSAGSRI
jgi:hypothetical protein